MKRPILTLPKFNFRGIGTKGYYSTVPYIYIFYDLLALVETGSLVPARKGL
jgi:hypothetical protein